MAKTHIIVDGSFGQGKYGNIAAAAMSDAEIRCVWSPRRGHGSHHQPTTEREFSRRPGMQNGRGVPARTPSAPPRHAGNRSARLNGL
jgi:hypothetical protein